MDKQLELQIKGHETHGSWAKWDLPDGYEFQDKEGNVINTNIIKLVKKQPKYPMTYGECCKIMGIDSGNFISIRSLYCEGGEEIITDYEDTLKDKIGVLWELLICRDAYWKIAGEEMGLGKPWVPDWSTEYETKYVIEVYHNNVRKNSLGYSNTVLAFPTAEMRDAFYDNFKELIEKCKELL